MMPARSAEIPHYRERAALQSIKHHRLQVILRKIRLEQFLTALGIAAAELLSSVR
jgi:hypothetical protein